MSSSVLGEDLGGRRTRKSVGPLRLARVECHPDEADRGGGWGQSQSASHTQRNREDFGRSVVAILRRIPWIRAALQPLQGQGFRVMQ